MIRRASARAPRDSANDSDVPERDRRPLWRFQQRTYREETSYQQYYEALLKYLVALYTTDLF
jgi:hypothetical protein